MLLFSQPSKDCFVVAAFIQYRHKLSQPKTFSKKVRAPISLSVYAFLTFATSITTAPQAIPSSPQKLEVANAANVIKTARSRVRKLTRDDVAKLRKLYYELSDAEKNKEEQQLLQVICMTKFATAEDFCDLGDTYSDVMGESGPAKLAQKSYEQALKIDPDYSKAYSSLSELALIEDHKEQALNYATRALACKKRAAHAFQMHANVLATMRRYDEALLTLNQAEKEVEMSAEMYRVKGSVLENLDRFADAVVAYRKSLSLGYSDWAAFQIVRCLEGENKYADALAELNKIVKRNPRDGEAYRFRAKIKLKLKNFKEALKDADTAVELEPTTKSLRQRALIHELMGRKDLARKDMREVTRIKDSPF